MSLSELSTPPSAFPVDLSQVAQKDLGAHLAQCQPARRALHRLRGIGEAMHEFVMPRIVSSIAGVGASAAVVLYLVS